MNITIIQLTQKPTIQKPKRLGPEAFMRRGHKNPTFESAKQCWGDRYVLMCDYLDELDNGNLRNIQRLWGLICIEDSWCSFDNRLCEFKIPKQYYQYDNEGLGYESSDDVAKKVSMLKNKIRGYLGYSNGLK